MQSFIYNYSEGDVDIGIWTLALFFVPFMITLFGAIFTVVTQCWRREGDKEQRKGILFATLWHLPLLRIWKSYHQRLTMEKLKEQRRSKKKFLREVQDDLKDQIHGIQEFLAESREPRLSSQLSTETLGDSVVVREKKTLLRDLEIRIKQSRDDLAHKSKEEKALIGEFVYFR